MAQHVALTDSEEIANLTPFLTTLTTQHFSTEHGLRMPVIAAAVGKRAVLTSITLTPEKKANCLKMVPERQNSMIQASITGRRLRDFDLWYQSGEIAKAIAGSERGTEEENAHEQLNILWLTLLAKTAVEAEQHQAARRMTGKAKLDKLQAIRNKEEAALIAHIKAWLKANSPAWLLDECNMNSRVNICDDHDAHRTPGYPLKERNEPYCQLALLGYTPAECLAYALAHDAWAITTNTGAKKLSGKDTVKEGTWLSTCAFQTSRDGTTHLRMLPETALRNIIVKKRHKIDWSSFLARGPSSTLRTNAAFQMEQDAQSAQREPYLVPIVVHGYEEGLECFSQNDASMFGSERKQQGLPSYYECHLMTPQEQVFSIRHGKLPMRDPFFGRAIAKARAPTVGTAVIVDRHVLCGDAIALASSIRRENVLLKSYTDNVGQDGSANVIALAALAECGRRGSDFYHSMTQTIVDRFNTRAEWDAIGIQFSMPLVDATTGRCRQIPNDAAYTDFMQTYATVNAPVSFMGVASTVDVIQAFIMSKSMTDTDPANGTVHLYVCRPHTQRDHTFVVAWQFTPAHLTAMATAHGEGASDDNQDGDA